MKRVVTVVDEELEANIQQLLNRWRDGTAVLSSSSAITGQPAYLEIIAIGPDALPTLFRDLEKTQDGHLSKALTTITGAHPIADEDRGHIRKIAAAWLQWAADNGYR